MESLAPVADPGPRLYELAKHPHLALLRDPDRTLIPFADTPEAAPEEDADHVDILVYLLWVAVLLVLLRYA
jgi:hypothetical protein